MAQLAERPAGGVRSWSPVTTFILLISYFALFGILVGGQGVLWVEVIRVLGLSKSAFGITQLFSPLLAVGLLLSAGRLIAFAGKKRLAIVALALMGGAVALISGVRTVWGLAGALLIMGSGNGLLEGSMNGATLDWEQRTGRHIMNIMHAGFSGGAVLGAFIAGTLLSIGWSYPTILLLLAGLCGLILLATLPVTYPPVDPDVAPAIGPLAMLRFLLSRRALVDLLLLSAMGIIGESVANLWAVIYLRELGAAAFIGGAGFALFNGAMFVGRMLNAPFVARLGARFSLLASGAGLTLAGIMLVAGGRSVPLAIGAFVLLGLAVAGVIPTILTVAGHVEPNNSGAVAGGLMAAAYATFVVVPPVTGWLAQAFSLKVALLTVGLSGLMILWLARNIDGSPS
jgi:MFS family permease